ncbi:TWiK family of potassium channels protein 7-like [Teleopsis dalmanni]|uniref:TWiK family of potassium channels protein 7-like n=1 Tax=Teleopsis dalmanni TaxID=139649 RepID=UPI0018CE488A|nr:TWiK family of potassium channels protein 7-like [Teleopsis dalmanni]XP_037945213.1 TWiK family of potassium channels protein 7-like [Teleopsis dalmanni]
MSKTQSPSSSLRSNQPRRQVKRCCRNFFTFMCTQVGVGALIVLYAIFGAVSFMNIEREYVDKTASEVVALRHNCSVELWHITEELNTFDRFKWQKEAEAVLKEYQTQIAAMIKNGYGGRTPQQIWSFPAALMFCLSVITMIGYGNMVPRTPWGKGFTVIYSTFGIPLYILYFLNMGKVLARSFKFLYRSLHECTQDNSSIDKRLDALECGSTGNDERKRIIVPSTACLWVIIFYIITGTIMFANWEKWSYLNSFYFCMTSLCKIGFGDFVPGASLVTSADIEAARKNAIEDATADPNELFELQLMTDQNSKLAINFLYMLIGMGLVAMCYNLMREEVRVKVHDMKEDTKVCLEDTRKRFGRCFDSNDSYDDDYY